MGRISIDLRKAHLSRQHGDLTCVYSWFNDERAMFLIPTYRKADSWFIVAESAAWKYDNPHYLARQCRKACEVLGMEPSPNNWFKLANVIIEGLPDLITMPTFPDPEKSKATYGEVRLMADGQIVGGMEVRNDVEAGASYEAA